MKNTMKLAAFSFAAILASGCATTKKDTFSAEEFFSGAADRSIAQAPVTAALEAMTSAQNSIKQAGGKAASQADIFAAIAPTIGAQFAKVTSWDKLSANQQKEFNDALAASMKNEAKRDAIAKAFAEKFSVSNVDALKNAMASVTGVSSAGGNVKAKGATNSAFVESLSSRYSKFTYGGFETSDGKDFPASKAAISERAKAAAQRIEASNDTAAKAFFTRMAEVGDYLYGKWKKEPANIEKFQNFNTAMLIALEAYSQKGKIGLGYDVDPSKSFSCIGTGDMEGEKEWQSLETAMYNFAKAIKANALSDAELGLAFWTGVGEEVGESVEAALSSDRPEKLMNAPCYIARPDLTNAARISKGLPTVQVK